MNYSNWVREKFPSIVSLRIAKNSQDGTIAIYAFKDREFNIVNIVDDIVAIYNTIELYDKTLFFDKFCFIFKDILLEDTTTQDIDGNPIVSDNMKVLSIDNCILSQYTKGTIDFNTLENQIEITEAKIRQNNA